MPRTFSNHRGFLAPSLSLTLLCLFFFNDTATTEIYTLSLHDALPIWRRSRPSDFAGKRFRASPASRVRSEEHTSELQSRFDLVCRLLLEKKKHESGLFSRGSERKTISEYISPHRQR